MTKEHTRMKRWAMIAAMVAMFLGATPMAMAQDGQSPTPGYVGAQMIGATLGGAAAIGSAMVLEELDTESLFLLSSLSTLVLIPAGAAVGGLIASSGEQPFDSTLPWILPALMGVSTGAYIYLIQGMASTCFSFGLSLLGSKRSVKPDIFPSQITAVSASLIIGLIWSASILVSEPAPAAGEGTTTTPAGIGFSFAF